MIGFIFCNILTFIALSGMAWLFVHELEIFIKEDIPNLKKEIKDKKD